MSIPDWTDLTPEAKDAIIGPLWADGKSASEITTYFTGATRNAIIGRITRAKMRSNRKPRNTVRAKTPGNSKRMLDPANLDRPLKPKLATRPMTPIVSTSAFVTIANPDPPSNSVMDMINGERAPLAGTTPIDILSLPSRAGVLCRFPVAGGYCGVPCGDQVYCPTHYRIAYRETETKIKVPREARL